MKEQYKIIVLCNNCLHRNEIMVDKGELRPAEIQCENCHCMTSTASICSDDG